MDELLRHDNNNVPDMPFGGGDGDKSREAAGRALKEKALAAAEKFRICAAAVCTGAVSAKARFDDSAFKKAACAAGSKVSGAVARHPVSPLLYLVLAALGAGVFLFNSTYIRAYAVNVDGVEVGLVADTGEVDAAVSHVESRVASVLGTQYDYEAEVTYTPVYSTEAELTDAAEIEAYLYETAGAVMEGYVLTVDGQEMGLAASEEDIQALLDRVAAPYLTENTVDYGFLEEVSITSREMASNTEFDLDSIYDALTVNTIEEAYYTVVKGDVFVNIAKSLGMSMADLEALNPEVTPSKLWVGQALVIQQSVPFLSVYTLDNETYEAAIDSPIEYTDTDSMYEGETKLIEQGEDGLALVTADVTYINGYETEREVTESVTLVEPTVTQMLRGTKEKPKTASKGYYILPVSGYRITSRYGYRGREFHTGVDLAVSYGTAVKAADGGTVTYAGWKGNYGKLVIITHDNGSQTYYAHNSSLLVSVGDKVYQGQQIAKAGSTGRSSGSHCHFEIRINGSTVNPMNYVK